jgi:hypothetical protein
LKVFYTRLNSSGKLVFRPRAIFSMLTADQRSSIRFAAKPVEVFAQLTDLTIDGQPTGTQLWQQRKI